MDNKIIGPFFVKLNRSFSNRNYFWVQQDGAPRHYAVMVRKYLDTIFRNLWIGQRGSIECPPRSPDLTPLNFFLWAYVRMKYINIQLILVCNYQLCLNI